MSVSDSKDAADPDGSGVSPTLLWGCRFGSVLLGVTAGTHAMLAAMLLVARPRDPLLVEQLTVRGRTHFWPEYDTLFYMVGSLGSLALGIALGWIWTRRYRNLAPAARDAHLTFGAGLQVVLSALATVGFLAVLWRRVPPPPDPHAFSRAVSLVGPGMLAVVASLVGAWFGPGRFSGAMARFAERIKEVVDPAGASQDQSPYRRGTLLVDVAALLAIPSVVLISSCCQLAGKFVELEGIPFHHWDYFTVGAALRYAHGGALGTDVYSQYGVVWPVLYAWLLPGSTLTYGNVLAVFIAAATIYFLAFYLALKLYLGKPLWALAGVILAIAVQMYYGLTAVTTIWVAPSSTVLRSPMDVWFFLALLLHQRSGRARWAVLAGLTAGLGLLFETDTGIYLTAILVFYLGSMLLLAPEERGPALRTRLAITLASLAAMVGILLCGLTVASRGTLLRGEFWSGWLESLLLYGAGLSAMPMTASHSLWGPLIFLVMIGIYLTLFGLLLTGLLGRRAGPDLLLGGCLSAYGLCLMLLFVNRSHVFNLFHVSGPVCVISVSVAALAQSRLERFFPASRWMSWAALAVASALLVVSPGFRAYPHLWNRLARGTPPAGLTLMPGVCGLSEKSHEFVDEFHEVVERLKDLRSKGHTVAVLDPCDTMFYIASDCPPHGRYTSLVTCIVRKKKLEEAKQWLSTELLDYWIAREVETEPKDWNDTHIALLEAIGREYVLVERIGHYGVWRARDSRSARGRAG